MTVITRFAPSPTGNLHIGGARTALFNYLFAMHHKIYGKGGKFLLRIEDTDQERSNKEAFDAIYQGLDWLGIDYENNVTIQSQNISRHQEIITKLLEKDLAYYCYTSAEELAEMRQKAQEKNQIFRFQSPWRNKINSQHSSVTPVVRIKSPNDGKTSINDLVQGVVTINNNEIDDFVIARSNNSPTYMLSVVVDDHDMDITHIIRGDDHLTNCFKQKTIYQSLGWKIPEFAHIPLIFGNDGAKMSKRHGATSVIEYKKMGYLPQSLRNYLLKLGWSYGNEEFINDQEAIKLFNIENINKSPARFDFSKLQSVNKFYIKNLENAKLYDLIINDLNNHEFIKKRQEVVNNNEKLRVISALSYIKEKVATINELIDPCLIYLDNYRSAINKQDQEKITSNIDMINKIKILINEINIWQIDDIKLKFNDFCQKNNLKIKDFGPILRILLTFSSKSSGSIFEVIFNLGKIEVLNRISLSQSS